MNIESQHWKRLLGEKDERDITNCTDGKTEPLKSKELDPEYWMSVESGTQAGSTV